MKKIVIALAVIIVVLLGVLIFVPAKAPEAPTSPPSPMQVVAPLPDAVIASPVTIAGSVTGGGWFFEASFPVKVLDADGTVLGQGIAQAQPPEAWTSTGTVPFAATVTFYAPHFATGSIMLSKDNPSGLSQNVASFTVPIQFASSMVVAPGTIRGTVTLSPTCPVEHTPPDSACAPKPYATTVDVYRQVGSATPYKVAATDAAGAFSVSLDPGPYFLQPRGGVQGLPQCAGKQVQVTSGKTTDIALTCDTGIR